MVGYLLMQESRQGAGYALIRNKDDREVSSHRT